MRIILADHHTQALWALKTMLLERPAFEFLGEAVDSDGLLALAASSSPEIALIDWELPGKSIKELIAALHRCKPKPYVVVMGSQPEYGRLMLKAGADAFISKTDQPEWLIDTLEGFTQHSKA